MINPISNNMKKKLLLSLMILFSINMMAQEKGSYISLSGGLGPSGYKYQISGVNFAEPQSNILLGGQAGVGYSYYFTKNIGLSVGLGFSRYRTNARLSGNFDIDKYLVLGEYTDNDALIEGRIRDYELRIRTQNWKEHQSGNFIEIPLMFNLQKKFGSKEYFGLYLGMGVKFQIPFKTKYSVVDGDYGDETRLNVSGYYAEHNVEIGDFRFDKLDVSAHGFGTINNPKDVLANTTGSLNLRFNTSLVAEGGILISLSRRTDLALGAYIDYGISNINKREGITGMFTGPDGDYVSGAENNIGNGISYNSVIKSEYVNRVNTLAYGGKVGIRIKLGKLSERKEEPQSIANGSKDTTVIYDKLMTDSILKMMQDAIDAGKHVTEAPEPQERDIYHEDDVKVISTMDEPVYFDLNKTFLRPESVRELNRKIEILNQYPEVKLIIFGNTCNLGNETSNTKLGFERAEAVRHYLIDHGIDPERLHSKTQSSFDPEKPNTTEDNRQFNRRCDVVPVLPKKTK
jgi:outer membrane protein OmpA-like peptidoglycan-associated protein